MKTNIRFITKLITIAIFFLPGGIMFAQQKSLTKKVIIAKEAETLQCKASIKNLMLAGDAMLTIPKIYYAAAGPVSVPVHTTEIANLGSFQFTLEFDASKLTYIGISNWHPDIPDVLVGNPSAGKLTFIWTASDAGVAVTEGTFFNADFTFNGSLDSADIIWSDNPTPREFGNYDGNIFVPGCINGFVTGSVSPLVPDTINLPTTTVNAGESTCYNAHQTIAVAENGKTFTVFSGGVVMMIAGQNIRFLPGTLVCQDGYLWAYLTNTHQYCETKTNPIVANPVTVVDDLPDSMESSQFRVFPNPTTGTFCVMIPDNLVMEKSFIRVYSMVGELIFNEDLTNNPKKSISLGNKPDGIYIIVITLGDQLRTTKIIKTH